MSDAESTRAGECTVCNVCDAPGTIDEAVDVAQIRSNVRYFRQQRFTVWRCVNCRSLHSREAVDLSHYYAHYFLGGQRLDYFTRRGFQNRKKWLLAAGVTPEFRVLEYGCGHGLFVSFLRQQGFENVVGYDRFVPEFADEAWRQQAFDLAMSYDVIEHTLDPRAMLQEQAARLRSGGLLAVTCPNGAQVGLAERDEIDLHQPYHRHILSERALLGLAERAGLRLAAFRNRVWLDTLWPFVNWTFVSHYVHRLGNVVDVVAEPPKFGAVLTSPRLLLYGLAGYFFPSRSHMMAVFRKEG